MILTYAPMEGITNSVYRRVHAEHFGGAERYYSPFLAPDATGTVKASHLRELLPEANPVPLVPQILANNAAAFLHMAGALAELGYEEVNLNAGCPSATVTAKHKGAGMLLDLDSLARFLDEVFAHCPLRISVKTRLGFDSMDELEKIIALYNDYPLCELIVHARDRAGFYKSPADRDAFARALAVTKHSVTYNGDIFTRADYESLCARFPELHGVMLGRGAVADPALFRELRGGEPMTLHEFRAFHDALVEANLASGLSANFTLARMKELWFYFLSLFPASDRLAKAVFKSKRLDDYRCAVASLLANADFAPERGFQPKK